MQVKKFEAPTIQEALDTIKRELGPEAIILQTKKYKRGFGLMSKASVEVTAAVSERSLHKKQYAEARLPEDTKKAVKNMPADRQAEFLEKYAPKASRAPEAAPIDALVASGRGAASDRVEVSRKSAATAAAPATKRLTATRYAEIDEQEVQAPPARREAQSVAQTAGATAGSRVVAVEAGFARNAPIEDEIRLLKRMIEEMKNTQDSIALGSGAQALMTPAQNSSGTLSTPLFQDVYEQLVLNGVDKRFAYSLMKSAAFELGEERAQSPDEVIDQVAGEIMRTTEIEAPLSSAPRTSGPRIVALVGPTGVGKTTTVAKMASEALLKRNLKVGLINLDSYKVAAFDQLGTYAKILNVPFRSCANVDELKTAVQDFRKLDLVIIDTTGRSQRDPESLREMQAILHQIQLETQLVLSVTTRDSELYDMASRFAMFRPRGIIVSKLDEATTYGAIYNVSQKAKLPLLYFTTGQRVPEDIEEATRERVAALILDL